MFFFWFGKFKFDFLPRSYHVQNVSSQPWLMLRGQRNRIHRGFTSMQTLAEVFLVQTITASDWALKCLFFIFIWFIGLCVCVFFLVGCCFWHRHRLCASLRVIASPISHCTLFICVFVCVAVCLLFCPWNTTRSPRDPQTPRKGILGWLNLSPQGDSALQKWSSLFSLVTFEFTDNESRSRAHGFALDIYRIHVFKQLRHISRVSLLQTNPQWGIQGPKDREVEDMVFKLEFG